MFAVSEGKLRSFARDARGNVALLFALTLIPLLIGVGVAVDYGRALIVRERMQDAADAAGLAIGSWVGLSQADMKTKAQQFFDANYPSSSIGTVGMLNVSFVGSDIQVSVSGQVPTTFMQLANINTVDVGASTTIAVGMGTVEVALALDNSGSMSGSKISSLKTAASDLVDTLFASAQNSPEPDPIKIAVVPFAASVNVGSQYANASWMDTGAQNPTHADEQKAYGAPSTTNNFTLFSSLKDSNGNTIPWGGCVEARPTPYDTTDDAPSAASTKFVPMFAPDEPDAWTATTSNCTSGNKCYYSGSSNSTRRFNGAPTGSQSFNNYLPDAGDGNTCGTTFTVTSGSPATINRASHGFAANDQVIFYTTGSLPNGLSAGTVYYVISAGLTTNSFRVSTSKGGSAVNTSGSQSGAHFVTNSWTCQSGDPRCGNTISAGAAVGKSEEDAFAGKSLANSPNCKYGTSANKATVANITVGGLPAGPNFMCTTTSLSPLSTDKATTKSAVNAMAAQGATSVMEGALWGWRALSPGEPFAQGRAYNTEDNQKILVLMTDGQNTYYPNSKFVKSWYDLYGYVDRGRLGTTSTNSDTLTAAMDTRTAQACANIKAAGIIVYTVAFQIPGDEAGALTLLKNCATDSDKYFAPNTESELLNAFNAIGKDISMLRISQ
jgi:Flp pilus assembly protein TadG